MEEKQPQIFEFGRCRLEVGSRSLWIGEEFVSVSPKAFDLLLMLADASPNVVHRNEIMERLWPDVIVEDGNINFTISSLRKIPELKEVIKTVPKRGYRLDCENLVIDPVRVKVENADPSILEDNNLKAFDVFKKSGFFAYGSFAGVVLLLATITFLAYHNIRQSDRPEEIKTRTINNISTLAVLPFTGTDPEIEEDQKILMTSEVIDRLGSIGGLNVRPLDAVSRFSSDAVPAEVGKDLSVDAVIKGTWVKVTSGSEIEVELNDIENDTVVWKQKILIADNDSTGIYGDVAFQIASKLMTHLTDQDKTLLGKRYTDDPEAFKLYRKARLRFQRSRPGVFQEILDNYNKAISLDPGFALAYAGLADLFFRQGNSLEGSASMAAYRRAEVFARRALELDGELSEAHTGIGRIHRRLNRNYDQAEKSFRKAIELNPNNVTAYGYLGQLLILKGEAEAALELIKKIELIDPTAHSIIFLNYRGFEAVGDLENGLKTSERLFNLDKQLVYARIFYATFLYYNGHFEKMEEIVNEGMEVHAGFAFVWHRLLASAALKTGDHQLFAKNEEILKVKSAKSTKYLYWLAVLRAEQGRNAEAISALNECFEHHESWMMWMGSEPGFESIKTESEFIEILKKLNLPTDAS
ncbi:MAG: tetratricopeptide repeat protein [Acidobacteria bacterium]|nr:tetratricopeptide repeat protein [Acidobacteriota bacterium]